MQGVQSKWYDVGFKRPFDFGSMILFHVKGRNGLKVLLEYTVKEYKNQAFTKE